MNEVVRPLSQVVAFRIEYASFGLDPLGYHAVNLGLHLINVALVHALALALGGGLATAGAAAVLFGVSSIAFTPLHWATGVIELLACALALAATLLWLGARGGGVAWRWGAALTALAAMFSKETAVVWPAAVAWIEFCRQRSVPTWRRLLPAAAAAALFGIFFLASGQGRRFDATEAYATTSSPLFIAHNLFTYLRWSAALHEPIRDAVAAADPGAWRVVLPLGLALALALWRRPRSAPDLGLVGAGWWLLFLLPVLPLADHTYLYYLYLPWAGGAIAVAGLGRDLLRRWPRRRAILVGLAVLASIVAIEARNLQVRGTATRDALPVDPTVRDASLLRQALPALRKAALPPGARVGFVNPAPRARFDLTTGAPTRPQDAASRASYFSLEGALRNGETLRLFLPGLVYLGFSTTIPRGWEDAEWFYFEQRGRLEHWGRGRVALLRQAEVQRAARQWAAADSTLRRVDALGDTVAGQLLVPAAPTAD